MRDEWSEETREASIEARRRKVQHIARAINAPNYASVTEGDIRFRRTATHAQAAKELKSVGFQPAGKSESETVRTKMGRSTAYSSHREKVTEFTHPEGHTARLKTIGPTLEEPGHKTHYYIRVSDL